jgi:hypothetical protein
MNVAISGSRGPDPEKGRIGWTDEGLIFRVLLRLAQRPEVERVNVGDAPSGVDYLVSMIFESASEFDDKPSSWLRTYEARWAEEGRRAGHNRNAWMISESHELIALFAPGPRTPGTSNAVECARRRGISVHVYHEGEWS